MQSRWNLSSIQSWFLKRRPHKLGFILHFETQCQRHKKEKGAPSARPCNKHGFFANTTESGYQEVEQIYKVCQPLCFGRSILSFHTADISE